MGNTLGEAKDLKDNNFELQGHVRQHHHQYGM